MEQQKLKSRPGGQAQTTPRNTALSTRHYTHLMLVALTELEYKRDSLGWLTVWSADGPTHWSTVRSYTRTHMRDSEALDGPKTASVDCTTTTPWRHDHVPSRI